MSNSLWLIAKLFQKYIYFFSRLDPEFNADLPESKRWLKEYGARENEAFR